MIAQLRGRVIEKSLDKDALRMVLDVQGVGYEALLAKSSESRVQAGDSVVLFIRESVTAFDGATTLYGFLTREESEMFTQIRQNVDGMGPKKALEALDKITKSLPDFKRAILDEDLSLLISVFGFTKKTAEKLVFSLKGKIEGWAVEGPAKWTETFRGADWESLSGLVHLGYTEQEAREAVRKVREKLGPGAAVPVVLQEALRMMGEKFA